MLDLHATQNGDTANLWNLQAAGGLTEKDANSFTLISDSTTYIACSWNIMF